MIEPADIPELRDPDRQPLKMLLMDELCFIDPDVEAALQALARGKTEAVLEELERRRQEHCPHAHLHPMLLYCPECGLGESDA